MRALRLISSLNKPTSSSAAAVINGARFSTTCSDEQVGGGGSEVYQQKLKFQRPTTIKWRHSLGQLHWLRAPPTSPRGGGRFGLRTVLSVRNLHSPIPIFGSYTNKDQNGSFRLNHELVVKELNYIARHGQGSSETEDHEESQSDGGETGMEKYRERLHLWQLYFVNPYDWWDNRNSKLNSRQPDFKHKDTGEALWLSPNDPPWIKTETHRLDLRMADQGEGRQAGYRRGVSKWEYDE